jgi:deoxyadenosine/deoxycytidine kinase
MFSEESLPPFPQIDKFMSDLNQTPVFMYSLVRDYKLCITGNIAAGKSTILNILSKMFGPANEERKTFLSGALGSQQVICYPELWLKDSTGLEMLKRRINKDISANTFQQFVIDEWIRSIKTHSKKKLEGVDCVHLFERNIDDTVFTFANFANQNKEINDEEFKCLFDRSRETQLIYKIPSYTSYRNFSRILCKDIWSSIIEIGKIIRQDLYVLGIEQRIIGLEVFDEEAYNRIINRGRAAERNYTREYISGMNRTYKKLFDYLDSNDRIENSKDISYRFSLK